MDKEKIQDYWFNFLRDKNSLYYPLGDITTFGGEPDKLAHLVYDGVKTATTSAYDLYEPNEYMPQVGDYNIILDGDENLYISPITNNSMQVQMSVGSNVSIEYYNSPNEELVGIVSKIKIN